VPKRIVWAMLKLQIRGTHPKRHERKKKCMPKSMRKRKERNKDSTYLQIRGTHPKRERFMIQRSTKNIYN
jgi:hypothetical protein